MNNMLGLLPEGLTMALSQNIYAMQHFSSLSEPERQVIIARARSVSSREEMHRLVNEMIPH